MFLHLFIFFVVLTVRKYEDPTGTHFYVMYPTPAEPCFFLTKRGFKYATGRLLLQKS